MPSRPAKPGHPGAGIASTTNRRHSKRQAEKALSSPAKRTVIDLTNEHDNDDDAQPVTPSSARRQADRLVSLETKFEELQAKFTAQEKAFTSLRTAHQRLVTIVDSIRVRADEARWFARNVAEWAHHHQDFDPATTYLQITAQEYHQQVLDVVVGDRARAEAHNPRILLARLPLPDVQSDHGSDEDGSGSDHAGDEEGDHTLVEPMDMEEDAVIKSEDVVAPLGFGEI